MRCRLRTHIPLLAGLVTVCLVWPAPDTAWSAKGAAAGQMRACVNKERQRLGIAPLRWSRPLARTARARARTMAAGRAPFAHTARMRVRGGRFRSIGENIAAGHRNAAAACRNWRSSPGHYANWTSRRYTAIGTAVARGPKGKMYVQVFGGR